MTGFLCSLGGVFAPNRSVSRTRRLFRVWFFSIRLAERRLLLLPECVSFCDLETIPSSRWLAIGRGINWNVFTWRWRSIDPLKDVAVERLLLSLKSARSVRWTQKTIPLFSSSRLPCPLHSWRSKFARRAGVCICTRRRNRFARDLVDLLVCGNETFGIQVIIRVVTALLVNFIFLSLRFRFEKEFEILSDTNSILLFILICTIRSEKSCAISFRLVVERWRS